MPRRITPVQLVLVAVIVAIGVVGSHGHIKAAATLTVNSIADTSDANPGDGVCDDGGGNCTLRAAIQEANTLAGTDTIAFNITGAGPHTIQPVLELPEIIAPVIIDGYTQPGASPNTSASSSNAVLKIELDGTNAGPTAQGLGIAASNTTVKGLVINRFPGRGIDISHASDTLQASNNIVRGSFIGTDVSGTAARPNGF